MLVNTTKCQCQQIYQQTKSIQLNGFRNKHRLSFIKEYIYVRGLHFSRVRYNVGSSMNIFDRKSKTHQKNVAARYPNHDVYDYLRSEV